MLLTLAATVDYLSEKVSEYTQSWSHWGLFAYSWDCKKVFIIRSSRVSTMQRLLKYWKIVGIFRSAHCWRVSTVDGCPLSGVPLYSDSKVQGIGNISNPRTAMNRLFSEIVCVFLPPSEQVASTAGPSVQASVHCQTCVCCAASHWTDFHRPGNHVPCVDTQSTYMYILSCMYCHLKEMSGFNIHSASITGMHMCKWGLQIMK